MDAAAALAAALPVMKGPRDTFNYDSILPSDLRWGWLGVTLALRREMLRHHLLSTSSLSPRTRAPPCPTPLSRAQPRLSAELGAPAEARTRGAQEAALVRKRDAAERTGTLLLLPSIGLLALRIVPVDAANRESNIAAGR